MGHGPEPHPQPFSFFILRRSLTEVQGQALNLCSSCLSLLSSWDHRQQGRMEKEVLRLRPHVPFRVQPGRVPHLPAVTSSAAKMKTHKRSQWRCRQGAPAAPHPARVLITRPSRQQVRCRVSAVEQLPPGHSVNRDMGGSLAPVPQVCTRKYVHKHFRRWERASKERTASTTPRGATATRGRNVGAEPRAGKA